MNIKDFYSKYYAHPLVEKLCLWGNKGEKNLYIRQLNTSARVLAMARLYSRTQKPLMVVADNADEAGYYYFDFTQVVDKQHIVFFPAFYKNVNKQGNTDKANEILRIDTLNRISGQKPCITITYPEALIEKVVSNQNFAKIRISIVKGQSYDRNELLKVLEKFDFQEVDFVYEAGQFSVRGSIIDIFSYSDETPYRLDFFGDKVESIRTFDIERQLSVKNLDEIAIIPDFEQDSCSKISLLEFIHPDTVLIFNDIKFTAERTGKIYTDALIKANETSKTPDLFSFLINNEIFLEQIEPFRKIEFEGNRHFDDKIEFSIFPQPAFNKNFDLIADFFKKYIFDGYKIYVASDSVKQTDRIAAIFAERGDNIEFTAVEGTLHEGFVDNDLKICFFTDHQIFARFHKFSLKSDSARRGKAAMLLKELNQLKQGDFVVHHDHGIGQFGGLLKTEINGKQQEVIKLIYRGNDIIFVSINSLHKISKYRGKEGVEPTLSKLGTGAWERLKERTKSKVKDIARNLIKLYAKRLEQKGFEYSPDSYLQNELEASFLYEDTPDQSKATADIKQDMESERPMDRLVCGDVGFGKTEVAIRAAFKAVADNKQVAVLVPTTVLALQHFKTFSERLTDFPCNIEYLSRAKSAKQTKEIIEKLKSGKIDILIGTHKIVGNEIVFKDLGLLIIDEEQKFGVAIKEKLKNLKINVDTLTLTATPIPRTLQFSLLGARDLSIINTPPPNRYPVMTEVINFDEETIKQAIKIEMDRNGQIFFINNRIQSIYVLENKLKKLVPDARIAVAHGQMPTAQLEETIIDFINYEYDVLLATTVIESGVDMPNVNTIFVNNANRFGLSDLHQLRGRVGRSNRKAYCYLITPDYKEVTDEARRRLQAIETFSDLGSGFNIALQDLDIRGAGNMLGAEQSGFIAELGYETYQKILAEAVEELRDDEFADIFTERKKEKFYVSDCLFESDLDLMLPANYVSSVAERMSLYRELDLLTNNADLEQFKVRLIDRFGEIPQATLDLMQVLPLRWLALRFGVQRVVLRNGKMTLFLVSDNHSPYYSSNEFGAVLAYIGKHPRGSKLGDSGGRRYISFDNVHHISEAVEVFDKIRENVAEI